MKKIFTISLFFRSLFLISQVGINTPSPSATLDIKTKESENTTKSLKITNSVGNEIITVINSNGNLGINESNPAGKLHVKTSSSNGIISERYGTENNNPPYLNFRRYRGANATSDKGALQQGDILGAITFFGSSGPSLGYVGDPLSGASAVIEVVATENFTEKNRGAELRIRTFPNDGGFTNPSGVQTNRTSFILNNQGNVGIGTPISTEIQNRLMVNGEASKVTAGAWIANSDERLKKDIQQISEDEALNKLLQLQGVYYYWNDNITGFERPAERQIGLIAQNVQNVFPDKIKIDNLGYLQTAYGDYDPIIIEAIRALNKRLEKLENENKELRVKLSFLSQ